jgi:lipoprotein-anchoring transpeptidase ErfK/SrfK
MVLAKTLSLLLFILGVTITLPCQADNVLPTSPLITSPSATTGNAYGWGAPPARSAHWATPVTKPEPKKPIAVTSPTPAAKTILTDRKVVIDIPSRTLRVMDGNKVLKKYPVGVGRLGFMTPLGKHQVIRKIENPGWENPYKAAGAVKIRPGINNPLGTRWIGFKADPRGEFGIHGTDSPQSVGKLSSHGCVRMRVPDAENVFDLVDLGTPVEVTYQVVQLSQTETGDIKLIRYPDWFKRGVPSTEQVKQQIVQRFGPNVTVDNAALQNALTGVPERSLSVGVIDAKPTVSSSSLPAE